MTKLTRHNGSILFIPDFKFPPLNVGGLYFEEVIQAFISIKAEEDKGGDRFLPPEWMTDFTLKGEDVLLASLDTLISKRDAIVTEIDGAKKKLNEYLRLKSVIASDGNFLEDCVADIFRLLGFECIQPEGNREDLLLNFKSEVVIVEIKGVKGTAAEKHSAQLEKWRLSHYDEMSTMPKGLLIVNGYKEIPLEKRDKKIFPDQMLRFSSRREHCLMDTRQLLSLYIDYVEGEVGSDDIWQLIISNVGRLEYQSKI